MKKTNLQSEPDGDTAPLFGRWPTAYCVALGIFAFEILLLYVFTVVFA
jgi:hypothetical protein